MQHNVQHGRYCAGENIPKYHDINFVICIQPKHRNRGILLLPQHYYKLLEINFSSSICFVAALNPINTHLLLFLLLSPFPVAINPVVNDRRGPEKSLGRLEGTLGRLGVREEGGVTVQGIGGRGNKICSTNTKQQCALLLVSDTIMTIITTKGLVHYWTQKCWIVLLWEADWTQFMACVTHFAKICSCWWWLDHCHWNTLWYWWRSNAIVVYDQDNRVDENQYLEFRELSLCHGGMVASAIRVHSEQQPFTKCTQTTFANL